MTVQRNFSNFPRILEIVYYYLSSINVFLATSDIDAEPTNTGACSLTDKGVETV